MLLSGLVGLLVAATSACSSSSPPVTARIETAWPAPDLVSQYLETVELEAPGSLFPLITFLASHPHSPKFLREPLPPLSQHRAQRFVNAGTNPIFAPEGTVTPAETLALLEASATRSMLVREQGVRDGIRLALANRETTVLLEGMRRVWEEREAEVGAMAGAAGEMATAATAEPASDADEAAPSCESWIDVRGARACSEDEFWAILGLEQKDKSSPIELPDHLDSQPRPRLYPFDHVTPRVAALPRFVLYASPTSPTFPQLFTFLFSLSNPKPPTQSNPKAQPPALTGAPSPTVPPPARSYAPRLQLVLRWKPSTKARLEQKKLVLGGYGAALDIKKSDYLVIDDRLAGASSSSGAKPAHEVLGIEGGAAAKMEAVKKADVAELGVRTAQLILGSEDPFSTFVDITSAFPRLASHLPALVPNPSPHLMSEVSNNQMSSRLAMRPHFFLNGIPLSDADVDPFALMRLMRKERKVLADLAALSPHLSGSDVRDLLINGGPKAKASGGMRDRIDADALGELYDATDRDEGSQVILWWNDLEKDRRYQSWPTSVRDLLRPSYPGSMSQVAKNLNNVVFVLDLSQPVSLALITENVKQFVSRGIPIRFGVVPLVSPLGAEDAVETHLAQLLWYLTDAVGRGPAMTFLASLQKAANGQRVTVELARRKYEQVAGRLPPIDGGELASYDDVQKGVGRYKASASHSRLNKARQYLRRLGVALPNSLEEDDETAQLGSFFMNGAYFPLDDDFGQNLQRTLALHTQFLQQEFYLQSLTDSTDAKTFFVNLPTTHKRRNPFIFVSDSNPLKVVNLAKAFDGVDRTFTHGFYIEGASGDLNETTGYDVEGPPAVATMLIVTDLDTPTGAQLAKAALQLADHSTKVRLSFLHNPPSFEDAPHAYALSNTLWALHKAKKLDEILPGELISWIDLSISSEGPEDGVGLSWQAENPLKDLLKTKGVDKEKAFDALLWWEELQWLVAKLGFGPGENGIVINGRVVGPFPDGAFGLPDLRTLFAHELEKRIEPIVTAFNSTVFDLMHASRSTISHAYNLATSIVGAAHLPDPAQGMFGGGPVERSRSYDALLSHHSSVIGNLSRGALFEVAVVVDPATELAQRWAPIIKTLAGLNTTHVRLYLNPSLHVTEVPIKRFYEYVFEREPRFDTTSGDEIQPGVRFNNVPEDVLLTFGVDAQKSWFAFPKTSVHDLDNIRLADLPEWSKAKGVEAVLELEALVVEAHARELPSSRPPRGLQLELKSGAESSPHEQRVDTTVMANLGYAQWKAAPGVWRLGIRSGKGADVYELESTGADGWKSGDIATTGDSFVVSTLEGLTLYPRFYRNPGHELTELLDESAAAGAAAKSESGGGVVERLKSMLPFFGGGSSGKDVVSTGKGAEINVFTVASGLLYERMAFLMCVSVMRHTSSSVKFWFIENFLSPSFKAFLPHVAAEYGFDYELVTYKWPHWLRDQKEKQRKIWGYKILFLDVLFPLELDRVIFVDSDQIVRADLKELVDLDLEGAPYAYTPMGDDREEMEGFRFWKTGYWEKHLQGRPYHISALYVVDLDRFRQIAAGDRLRQQYQALSADPNSLANLDQDLPNQAWRDIPIYTLPQEWLWCETWCSDESLARAKTIDLCNNPATHEPKLQRARRLLPEWSEYDDEVAALAKRVLANDSTASSSSAAAFQAGAHELEQAVQQEQERESFVEERAQAAPAASGRVKDEL
ncbi:hypothetical protein JCM9279_004400 [Rhodotorula babjevae]